MGTAPRILGALLLVVVASACGASSPGAHGRGTPDLTRAFPSPTGSPFGLFDRHRHTGLVRPARESGPELDAYLKHDSAVADAAPVAHSARGQVRVENASPKLTVRPAAPASPSAAPAVVADPGATSGAMDQATTAPATAVSDAARYAQRQTKSRDLERYRGGDVIVIGVSTLVIVLLIVLLLVILL